LPRPGRPRLGAIATAGFGDPRIEPFLQCISIARPMFSLASQAIRPLPNFRYLLLHLGVRCVIEIGEIVFSIDHFSCVPFIEARRFVSFGLRDRRDTGGSGGLILNLL
jgi:hypothetical protein